MKRTLGGMSFLSLRHQIKYVCPFFLILAQRLKFRYPAGLGYTGDRRPVQLA